MIICRNLNLSLRRLMLDNLENGMNVLRLIRSKQLRNLWKKFLKESKKILVLLKKVRRFISLNFWMKRKLKFSLERRFIRDLLRLVFRRENRRFRIRLKLLRIRLRCCQEIDKKFIFYIFFGFF